MVLSCYHISPSLEMYLLIFDIYLPLPQLKGFFESFYFCASRRVISLNTKSIGMRRHSSKVNFDCCPP